MRLESTPEYQTRFGLVGSRSIRRTSVSAYMSGYSVQTPVAGSRRASLSTCCSAVQIGAELAGDRIFHAEWKLIELAAGAVDACNLVECILHDPDVAVAADRH